MAPSGASTRYFRIAVAALLIASACARDATREGQRRHSLVDRATQQQQQQLSSSSTHKNVDDVDDDDLVSSLSLPSSSPSPFLHQTSLVSQWLDSPLGPESVDSEDKGSDEKKQQQKQHKPLLPLSPRDAAGFVAVAAVVALAAGGGIGGGGLLVPLYLLVFGFETRDAVALSNITILGGAIASFAFNLPRRHPTHKDRPLISWDMILIMEPSTICGAVAGALLNKVTPTWLTTSLLFVLLTAMTQKLVSRSRKVWRLEGEERRLARAAAEEGQERVQGLSALLLEEANGGAGGAAVGADEGLEEEEEEGPLLLGSTLASAPSVPSLVSFADEAAASPSSSPTGENDSNNKPKPASSRSPLGGRGLFFSRRRTGSNDAPSATSPKPPKPPAAVAANGIANGNGIRSDDVERQASSLPPASSSSPSPSLHGGSDAHLLATITTNNNARSPFSEPHLAPPSKVAAIFALTLAVAAADLAKQRVRCGSLSYWLLVSAVVPPSLLVALTARTRLVKEHELRSSGAPGWPRYERGDVQWTRRASLAIPAISTLAGVVAGFFGVGGGIVKGPLMIALHVAPEIAAATSITMILFTSSAASVVYLSFGVPNDYALCLFALGAAFTAVGQVAVTRAVKKLGRPSIIVITMAAMMAVSAVVVFYEAESLTREAVMEHALGKHGHIC